MTEIDNVGAVKTGGDCFRKHSVMHGIRERRSCVRKWLIRVGDYERLARSWRPEAMLGDKEKQERLAELLLGPHAREAKARPYEGIRFLFRAAVNGRRTAVLRLADALNEGKFVLSKRPYAARCWADAPSSFAKQMVVLR
jgi:hypothetical protein